MPRRRGLLGVPLGSRHRILAGIEAARVRWIVVSLALACSSVLSAGAQTLAERRAACLACHGENGQSEAPDVPSLGAQPEFFVTVQLLMFREKMRVVPLMNDVTKGLSDRDLQNLAAFFAKQPPPRPAADLGDPARIERAKELVVQHRCNFCHRRDFSGEQNAPRLAAQREDYLAKTMREYKTNTRRGYDASMADVVYALNDDDILDLSHYLARVK
jgi:cytochrome c553